jgi:hypothetical protein
MSIDLETCVKKVRAMKTARPTPEEEKCRNCTKENELYCENYLPISRSNMPVRKGPYAMLYFGGIKWNNKQY